MSLMDDEELKKYFLKQNREMGRPGWRAGLGPPDMYGNQSPHTQEGWKDITRQQLETNQFGPNLPRGLGLLESREQAEQVLGHRLEDNMGPQLQQSPTDMMRTDGIPILSQEEIYAQQPAGGIGGTYGATTGLQGIDDPSGPRFAAANQMGVAGGYDHQMVNAPMGFGMSGPGQDTGPPPGLLADDMSGPKWTDGMKRRRKKEMAQQAGISSPQSTTDKSGWDRDKRWSRAGEMLVQFGSDYMREDPFGDGR